MSLTFTTTVKYKDWFGSFSVVVNYCYDSVLFPSLIITVIIIIITIGYMLLLS